MGGRGGVPVTEIRLPEISEESVGALIYFFEYACGVSGYSFTHNAISILCARLPLAWLASRNFPGTLFPMGCAAPAGSLVSVVVCAVLLRRLAKKQAAEEPKAA